MRKLVRLIVPLSLFFVVSEPGGPGEAATTCSASTTLEALATCIRDQMPRAGSNGFVAPTAPEQADWRAVVHEMLHGSCGFTLPASLGGIMRLSALTDANIGRGYCVLMEVRDANNDRVVDRGWGTFIVYNGATRELSHQAPHPIADSTTEIQAVTLFKETDSRSYLMAGAHRDANAAASACQGSYKEADAAHNVATMFQATNEALLAHYGPAAWTAIQWHGMAAGTCPTTDVYLSHGSSVPPGASDGIAALRANVLAHHPAWQVDVPGAGVCSLNATENAQGRLINGVPAGSVCGTAAASYGGRFIHIEQDPGFRNAADWIGPIADTWSTGPPAAATSAKAIAAKRKIGLTWAGSSNATGYNVKRSATPGGPYATIAAGVTGTSYMNTGLTPGATYYYVVTAVNAAGESGMSNQTSAKAR